MDEPSQKVLSVADYVVFGAMLLVSSLIGVFYAIRDKKLSRGTDNYLMANRSMSPVPVGFSLTVSFMSSLLALGFPAHVYTYGITFLCYPVSLVFVSIVVSVVFIPTLYNLGITSTYEYLEKRFSKGLRLITTATYLVQNLLYMGVNVYGPALVLSEVTGFPILPAMLSTGLVVVFYTTLGGFRGVIWTDVFQGCIMLAGLLAFVIQGSIAAGGFHKVWEIAGKGNRTNSLRFGADPRIRYTVWSTVIGGFILWLGVFGTNQTQVQRLLSVKSQRKSRIALFLGTGGILLFMLLASFCGFILYSLYHQCDPINAGCIKDKDQMMPYAVLDIFRGLDGLPGLFVAFVFSASLSTVSSGINAMITVTIEDFIKPHTKWSEKKYTWIAKALGIVFGGLTFGVAFLTSVLGDIMTMGIGAVSSFAGPSLGIFLLGIWFPFANSAGAICGFVVGVVLSMTMFLGGKSIRKPDHLLGALVVSTERCPANCGYLDSVNVTSIESPRNLSTSEASIGSIELGGIENYYAISYFYTASVGLAFTLVIGIVCSLLTCGWRQRHDVNPRLLRPPFESQIFAWLPRKVRSVLRCGIDWKDGARIGHASELYDTAIKRKSQGRDHPAPHIDFTAVKS